MRVKVAAAIAGFLAMTACVQEARMRLPMAPAAELEEVALVGIGFRTAGSFTVAGAEGDYSRGGERVDAFEVTSAAGGTGFSLRGGPVREDLSGFCQFNQKDVRLGRGLTATVEPLFFHCGIDRSGAPIGDIEINAGGLSGSERRGTMMFDGRLLEIRSVHKVQGSPLPTDLPIGYVFLENGREVGGVDVNGGTKRLYLPRDPELREAALAASVALAVFQEPENTGLID
jgi:hypothetical protein